MSSPEEYRTKCPFCSVQDDVIIKRANPNSALFTRENLPGLYVNKKSDRGLCPRGNFTIELLTSPYRLRNVMINGKIEEANKAINQCVSELLKLKENKNELAILVSGNHTLEEAYLAKELADELNTELIGLFPFEDEALLSFKNDFSFNELTSSDMIFTVGDIFSNSPTLAKPIIDARNRERRNRLLYLDIIGGRLSPFSESFICNPGYVAYFLSILLDYIEDNKKKVELEKTRIGIPSNSIEKIVKALKESRNGWILFSNIYGHFKNPLLITSILEEIASKTDNHFACIPIGQNSFGVGRIIGRLNNQKIIEALKNGNVKGLLILGGLPFDFIPDFESYKKKLDFLLSSNIFKTNDFPGYLFPAVLSVEKKGSLISLEEEIVSLGNPISPVPGAVSDGVLISELIKGITGKEVKAYVEKIGPLERKIPGELSAPRIEIDEEFPFTLIGVGLPYHHSNGGITRMTEWNKERGGPYLLMNPSQYKEIGLGNKVKVVTPYSNITIPLGNLRESPYEISKDVLAVPAHYMECRNLFPFEADSDGIVSPGAVKAKIEQ